MKLKRRIRGRPKNISRALAKEPEDGEHAQPRDEDEAGGERPEETGGANRTKGTRTGDDSKKHLVFISNHYWKH